MNPNGEKTLQVRVTKEEYDIIKAAAKKQGIGRPLFVRRASIDIAEKVMHEQS